VHFEIFDADRLGGELGRAFRYVNAGADGPLVRRARPGRRAGRQRRSGGRRRRAGDFFRSGRTTTSSRACATSRAPSDYEWGDHTTEDELVGLRELAGVPEADRRRSLAGSPIAPMFSGRYDRLARDRAAQEPDDSSRTTADVPLRDRGAQQRPRAAARARAARSATRSLEARKLARPWPIGRLDEPRAGAAVEPPLFGPLVGYASRRGARRTSRSSSSSPRTAGEGTLEAVDTKCRAFGPEVA